MTPKVCSFFLFFSLLLHSGKCEEPPTHQAILDYLFINKTYTPGIRPNGTGGHQEPPVVVTVNVYLRRIELNDDVQTYTAQMTFRQFWTDSRLSFENLKPRVKFVIPDSKNPGQRLWLPDTFFQNEVDDDIASSDHANSLTRINANGVVMFSEKFTSTFACPIKLQKYPFDRQICHLNFSSYGYTSDEVTYVWQDESNVQFMPDFKSTPGSYAYANHTISNCSSTSPLGTFSCLRLTLEFARLGTIKSHRVFAYSYVLVFASWAPFWLDRAIHVTARTLIGMACLVTTVVFNHLITDDKLVENVGYVTPVHVWTDSTLAFVFLAFVETVAVVAATLGSDVNYRQFSDGGPTGYDFSQELADRTDSTETARRSREILATPVSSRMKHWGQRLEVVSRVTFPVVYLLFNIIFYSLYAV